MLIKMRKAQSTLEYALIIAVVIGAVLAMQVYVKRGFQGRLKATADEFGEQYSPGYTTGEVVVTIQSESTETLSDGETEVESETTQEVEKDEETPDYEDEYWGF